MMDWVVGIDFGEIYQATLDTLLMLGLSVFFSSIIGIPVGILLHLTGKGSLWQNSVIYNVLSLIVNVLRSIPFIILLIVMIPISIFLVGTSLGAIGAIPPLVFAAFAFFSRLTENALKEVDSGVIYMAESCGATTWQIIWRILLPEILPSIVATITVTAVTLVSYTAMAGAVGGGGLGDLAIRYGYQRFDTKIMLITVVLMVLIVQIIQFLGDRLARYLKH